MFELYAEKNRLEVLERETLTSGSVNVYPVRFTFSEDWAGFSKTAVFRCGGRTASMLLDNTGECSVPWEVLREPGRLLAAGVYGTLGGDTGTQTKPSADSKGPPQSRMALWGEPEKTERNGCPANSRAERSAAFDGEGEEEQGSGARNAQPGVPSGADFAATVLPTVWANLGTVLEGAVAGKEAQPPTPDIWQQRLDAKGDALDYDGGSLSLMSGDRALSTVRIGTGVSDHRLLSHRDAAEQHPIASISGLDDAIRRIPAPVEPMTNQELEELLR